MGDGTRTVKGYALGRRIGRGAMGEVYAATHLDTGTRVAVKLVRPASTDAALALDNEIRAMARLNHPKLLALYDYGRTGSRDEGAPNSTWLALEHCGAGSLARFQPRSWDPVEAVIGDVLGGLGFAHAGGLLHRDIKPSNLLRATNQDSRPGLKIADFGLAWAYDHAHPTIRYAGTPRYAPPEQIHSEVGEQGPWSDLYALAAVIWRWVTWRPVFAGTREQVLEAHLHAPVPAFEPRFAVPDTLEPILRWMLHKDPQDRPRCAQQVREALGLAELESTSRAFAPSSPHPGIGLGLLPLREPPLVGHHDHQRALSRLLDERARDRSPHIAVLVGPEGTGRRTLARWTVRLASERGFRVFRNRPADPAELLDGSPHPRVVQVDALGQVDEGLLAAIAFSDRPVLLVATGPDAWCCDALAHLPGVSIHAVGPLTPPASHQLLSVELGLDPSFADAVATAAEHHSGMAVRWIRSLARRDLLHSSPEGFVGTLDAPPEPDEDLRALLASRLAAMTPERANALLVGAVMGRVVLAREWVATLKLLGLAPTAQGLSSLARVGLVDRTPTTWRWTHPAVRAHAASRVEDPQRVHLAIAEALASRTPTRPRIVRRGLHLLEAGRHADGLAVLLPLLRELPRQDREMSIRLLRPLTRAAKTASPAQRHQILMFEAASAYLFHGPEYAQPLVDRLLAASSEQQPTERARGVELAAIMLGRVDTVKAGALVAELPPSPRVLYIQALADTGRGDTEAARAKLLQVVGMNGSHLGSSCNELGNLALREGDFQRAIAWFERALPLLVQDHVALANLSLACLALDDCQAALDLGLRAYPRALPYGLEAYGICALVISIAAGRVGDSQELDRYADLGLYALRRYPLGTDEPLVARLVAEALPTSEGHARDHLEAVRAVLSSASTS